MLFQTCTELTSGLSDVFAVTVIAENRINGVGSASVYSRGLTVYHLYSIGRLRRGNMFLMS